MNYGSVRLTGRPTDHAGPRGQQNQNAKDDPVPSEDHEIMLRDVAQQPTHAQEGREERSDKSHCKEAGIRCRQKGTMLEKIVGAGSDKRRHRQEEREFGRRLARETEQHPSNDGCART